jgi:hypothetical protein
MISGIDKYKLDKYEKLIKRILNECNDLGEAAKLIIEAEHEINIYSQGYKDATPPTSYFDR